MSAFRLAFIYILHFIRWKTLFPLDKIIRSLNNWGRVINWVLNAGGHRTMDKQPSGGRSGVGG